MKIAFYSSHHTLATWGKPNSPLAVFDKEKMASFKSCGGGIELQHTCLWNILCALAALPYFELMAHVSLIVSTENETIEDAKRFWVHITTLPSKTTWFGIPVTVIDYKINPDIHRIWVQDNPLVGSPEDDATQQEWEDFFNKKIVGSFKKMEAEIEQLESSMNEKKINLAYFPHQHPLFEKEYEKKS